MTLTVKNKNKEKIFSENSELSSDGHKYSISEKQKFYEIFIKCSGYEVELVLPADGAAS
jgi:hypothetical protein